MNSHSHKFTPKGNVSKHVHGFSWEGAHTHNIYGKNDTTKFSHEVTSPNGAYYKEGVGFIATEYPTADIRGFYTNTMTSCITTATGTFGDVQIIENTKITISKDTVEATPTFTGIESDTKTTTNSGTFTGTTGTTSAAGTGNTGSTAPSFTGTAGTTESNGSGSSFSILPPYIVKYCWERTA